MEQLNVRPEQEGASIFKADQPLLAPFLWRFLRRQTVTMGEQNWGSVDASSVELG
jgi:hypothetical protein